MSQLADDKIASAMKDHKAVLDALRTAQIEAMRKHVFGNVPMVSWKDGKVIEIPPSELMKRLESLGVPLFGSVN